MTCLLSPHSQVVAAATQTLKVFEPAKPCWTVRGVACCSVSQATLDAQSCTGGACHSGTQALELQKTAVLEGEWDLGYSLELDSLGLSL